MPSIDIGSRLTMAGEKSAPMRAASRSRGPGPEPPSRTMTRSGRAASSAAMSSSPGPNSSSGLTRRALARAAAPERVVATSAAPAAPALSCSLDGRVTTATPSISGG